MKLYHYWRSSSSWRVRWALDLKKIKANLIHVDLLNGDNEKPSHTNLHPMGYVPVLETGGRHIIQSVAILEFLDEKIATPSLFTGDVYERAHIRSLVETINADTQPIQNLSVMEFYSSDPYKQKSWNQHFISRGLKAFEDLAQSKSGVYSVGDKITAADLLLVPQCYNALRFDIDLDRYPRLRSWYENALKTPEAQSSKPEVYKP